MSRTTDAAMVDVLIERLRTTLVCFPLILTLAVGTKVLAEVGIITGVLIDLCRVVLGADIGGAPFYHDR